MKLIFLISILLSFHFCSASNDQLPAIFLQIQPGHPKVVKLTESLPPASKNAKEDIDRINALLDLATAVRDGNPDSAMSLGNSALQLSGKINWQMGIGQSYHLIATVFGMKGDYTNALLFLSKAVSVWDELDKGSPEDQHKKIQSQKSKSLGNIGMVYWHMKDYDKALEYHFMALKIDEELGNKNGIARHLGNIGNVYKDKADYSQALDYELRALAIHQELGNQNGIATILGNIGSIYVYQKVYIKAEKYLLDAGRLSDSIRDFYGAMEVYENLSELYSKTGDYKKALDYYKKAVDVKFTLFNEKKDKEILSKTMNFEFEKKDALARKELQRQKLVRNAFIGGTVLFLLLAIAIFIGLRKTAAEKIKSEGLLLNILPAAVAQELKQTGHCLPKTFSMVTVLFADFKDFTSVSEKISAELLVNELNYCFSAFDNILNQHHIEKIKTVGDAYMCAGGLPTLNYTHAFDVVLAALDMRNFILARKKEKESKGEIGFEIRIGIHTGPVVAGIVGINKFSYDIWGDTVNIAARMEQNCEAGHVNISGSTYELIKEKFNCVHRGKIQAKNKGQIDMYFAENISSIPPTT